MYEVVVGGGLSESLTERRSRFGGEGAEKN